MTKGAAISACNTYRYALWRIWDSQRPCVLFIGLNPSTADQTQDDPTVLKCIEFARRWRYGGIYIGNLFAYRTSDPREMRRASDPVGPENDKWLKKLAAKSKMVVAAWGQDGVFLQRSARIRSMMDHLHYLKLNRSGEPAHPLYLPRTTRPSPWPTTAAKLNGTLLTEYADKFYGFGNWNAKTWCIGIEEAGGWKIGDIQQRLDSWQRNGKPYLEDAPPFYPLTGNQRWHGPKGEAQATWRKLILMLMVSRGQASDESSIVRFQRNEWGAIGGDTCLAELFPLPSPDTKQWNYGSWSDLPWLRDRAVYNLKVRASRENELRRKIKQHKPKVVIFYGLELPGRISLLPSWSSIAGGNFEQAFEDRKILLRRQTVDSTFYVTRHPCAESDNYFRDIGAFLHKKHANQI